MSSRMGTVLRCATSGGVIDDAVPAVSGAALDPAQQFRPVVLMSAYVFRVVIEDALTERREQDVRLRVAKFRDDRKRRAFAQLGDGRLAGVGPWLQPVSYEAYRQFPAL